jgi:hypothetical protein
MEVVLATVMVIHISVEAFMEVADITVVVDSIVGVDLMMEVPHPHMADAVTTAEEVNVEV